MDDDVVKAHLHQKLRAAREALVWKLEGLSEYDVRRPVTTTGTNLLGLVKHNAISDSRYFGEVFHRPFPEPLPRWDDPAADLVDHWAAEHETRADIVDLHRRVSSHADATIEALDLGDRGYVPWWEEEVPLFNVMVARLVDASSLPLNGRDRAQWDAHRARVEKAAIAASRAAPGRP